MVSPEIQETAIRDYCAARGYVLADVIEGLDESGSQKRSSWWRRLDDAVAAVEDGTYDGIVVWKFSRAARHRLRWAVALDRVDVAGGVLESATEQFDTTTSAGRFARGMVAEMNAFEAERIGEVWKEAHGSRIRAGRPHSGKARFGYVYDSADKLHKPHPEQGPLLADLYRRYVAGESIGQLVQWLNVRGWRSMAGNPWSDATLRRLLDNGFAAGMFRYHDQLHRGAHEALIDANLWQAYQDARVARRKVPPRAEHSGYLLSGLVRCARCGFVMVAYREEGRTKFDRRRGKKYSTKGVRLSWRCKRCPEVGKGPAGYVASWRVEAEVMAHVRDLVDRHEQRIDAKAVVDSRRTLTEVELARLTREGVRLEEALVRLAVSHSENPLPEHVYARSRAELEERAATVKHSIEALSAQQRRGAIDAIAAAEVLLERWEELPVQARREVLKGLLDCVLVRTGKEPWMEVVPWVSARG